jgi:hypothetical protein
MSLQACGGLALTATPLSPPSGSGRPSPDSDPGKKASSLFVVDVTTVTVIFVNTLDNHTSVKDPLTKKPTA